ncbi:MAG: c-type cytochrome [Betaproteobacteria bacterium]|nr:c-type cytochrome [Betaproteobacteria bacterium]
MSEHSTMTKTTPMQVILATLGGLLTPGLVIFMIVMRSIGIAHSHINYVNPALANRMVMARIKPVAELKVVDLSAAKVEMTGQQVFQAVCTACHSVGALGSPKFGDKAAWAPHIAKGYPTLVQHALNGFKKMPARGGDPSLDNLEVERADRYMADAGGANFKAPDSATAPVK